MKILTSVTILTTAEGKKVSYTFSELDAQGSIIKANVRESFIVFDETLLATIADLENKITTDKLNA